MSIWRYSFPFRIVPFRRDRTLFFLKSPLCPTSAHRALISIIIIPVKFWTKKKREEKEKSIVIIYWWWIVGEWKNKRMKMVRGRKKTNFFNRPEAGPAEFPSRLLQFSFAFTWYSIATSSTTWESAVVVWGCLSGAVGAHFLQFSIASFVPQEKCSYIYIFPGRRRRRRRL